MSNQEIIRREQFCQILQEINGSTSYLVVGIDVAKQKHHAFMGTPTGSVLFKKLVFQNDITGFSQLLKTAEQIKTQNGLSKIVYGLEATGAYYKPLARYISQCDGHVVLVSGQAVKSNRRILNGRWDKNDTKDAANVADLVSRGKCIYYDTPSTAIAELRTLLSLRRRLKKAEHRLRMRIRNTLLAQYFPELDAYYGACENESLSIIRWCMNPDKIASMEYERFFRIVTKTQRGIAQKLRLQKIYQAAIDSVGCPMGESVEFEAELLVAWLKTVRGYLKQTEALIKRISLDIPEYIYLMSIPGFGPYISARVLASIGDPFRFENRQQLIKLSGYDLCANRSGKTSQKAVPVISKQGNSELRYALYQAAHVAVARTDLFRSYFVKLLQGRERERGIKTKMRVKIAVKMLVIAWTLMKKREVFNPELLGME